MSKRKLGSLFLMSPIIVFLLSVLITVILSILFPSIVIYQILILKIVAGLLLISIIVWLPLGIIKIVNSGTKSGFSISKINRFSRWETKKKFWMFVLFFLTYIWVQIVLSFFLDDKSNSQIVLAIANVFGMIAWIVFFVWFANISLTVADEKKLAYSALFEKINYFFHFLVTYVLYILIVIGWTILFIVPWIYRGVRFSFYQYLIIEEGYTPIKALKESRKITKGKFRDVFAYTLVLGLINLLWMLCLFIGLLWTIPMTMIAQAKMYKALSK